MDSAQLGGNEKQPPPAEIDTSAPFESVKEATSRFGGMGFWRPSNNHSHSHQNGEETMDIAEMEEQAAQLERDLALKEKETLDVLKELETTKMVVEELKSDLQKEASEVSAVAAAAVVDGGLNIACPNLAPGNILMELKQAKLNLGKTTDSLADIRATVESYSKKIEKERASLEKTRQRLSSSASKVSYLESELNQTKETMELVTCVDIKVSSDCTNNMDLAKELQRLSSETEQFKKVGEAARSEVSRAISEMEQTRLRIKTTESRLVAAKKMKEAARAAESVALAEIKALSNGDNVVMTISFEEYSSLMSRVREAEANCESKLANAADEVEGANVSKDEILKKVEEATEEVKSSKMVLEEALSRVENANKGKLAVEEALRKWRSERGQKKRLSSNPAKFKNPGTTLRKDSCADDDDDDVIDVSEELMKPVLKPTISIGQILSRKLLLKEEFEKGDKSFGKRKVSLAQMLGKHYGALSGGVKEAEKENAKLPPTKRKKFGLAKISLLVAKQQQQQQQQQQSKKKKRQSTFASGCMMSQ